jgi:Tfp pilus assembly major pilin PilA
MSRFVIGCLVVVAVAAVPAQAQKAYKQVDEKGNVTYSQTPPTQGKEAKKVDIAPAQAGRGVPGSTGGDSYRIERTYTYQSPQQQEYQRAREEAEKKRKADLVAECNRNRGTDCNNPETLRLMEAQKIPGGRNYPQR